MEYYSSMIEIASNPFQIGAMQCYNKYKFLKIALSSLEFVVHKRFNVKTIVDLAHSIEAFLLAMPI